MSFVKITTTPRYLCVSTDVKPTAGVPVGSTAYEIDTFQLFQLTETGWAPKPSQALMYGMDGTDLVGLKVDDQGRIAVSTDITVGDVTIGTVTQGDGDPLAVPWEVTMASEVAEGTDIS